MTAKLDFELFEAGLEIFRCVVPVMKMYLHLAVALPTKLGKVVEEFGPVFFGREEKRVLRRSAIDIVKLVGKFRVVLAPMASAGPGDFRRWFGPEWFVVIHEAEEHMRRRNEVAPLARGEIAGEPDLGVFEHSNSGTGKFQGGG